MSGDLTLQLGCNNGRRDAGYSHYREPSPFAYKERLVQQQQQQIIPPSPDSEGELQKCNVLHAPSSDAGVGDLAMSIPVATVQSHKEQPAHDVVVKLTPNTPRAARARSKEQFTLWRQQETKQKVVKISKIH